MEAFIPPQPITPSDIGLPSQPSCSSPFGITGHGGGAIEGFVAAFLCLHQLDQKESKRRDRISMKSLPPIELRAIWQTRKGVIQRLQSPAIKGPLTLELAPLSKQRQAHHFTTTQRSWSSYANGWVRKMRLAKIISHDVKCSQESLQVYHQLAPFLGICFDNVSYG
jgi:hypothetical protein